MEERTGSLFEKHFERKKIRSKEYLRNLIIYIPTDPSNHAIYEGFAKYPFSSYPYFLNPDKYPLLPNAYKDILRLFGDTTSQVLVHKIQPQSPNWP